MFKNIAFKIKLLLSFLAVGVIPFAIGIYSLSQSSDVLRGRAFEQIKSVMQVKKTQMEQFFSHCKSNLDVLVKSAESIHREAFEKLKAVRAIKKNQIESYFNDRLQNLESLASNNSVLLTMARLHDAYTSEKQRPGGSKWQLAKKKYAIWLIQYAARHNYPNILLIAKNGDIPFTSNGKGEQGQNVITGSLKESVLSKCFQKVIESGRPSLQDFEMYALYDKPTAFMGAPLKKGDHLLGVLIFEVSLDEINRVMQVPEGLGETGDAYLVGPDGRLRSNSHQSNSHTVKASFAGMLDN